MTRPSTPPILTELRSPSSPASQVAALRALKNEIIGHEQKKEMWVGLGVVTPIVRILNASKGSGKRKGREINGAVKYREKKVPRTDEEEARLQAIIIVGSLAQGKSEAALTMSQGPSYLGNHGMDARLVLTFIARWSGFRNPSFVRLCPTAVAVNPDARRNLIPSRTC